MGHRTSLRHKILTAASFAGASFSLISLSDIALSDTGGRKYIQRDSVNTRYFYNDDSISCGFMAARIIAELNKTDDYPGFLEVIGKDTENLSKRFEKRGYDKYADDLMEFSDALQFGERNKILRYARKLTYLSNFRTMPFSSQPQTKRESEFLLASNLSRLWCAKVSEQGKGFVNKNDSAAMELDDLLEQVQDLLGNNREDLYQDIENVQDDISDKNSSSLALKRLRRISIDLELESIRSIRR